MQKLLNMDTPQAFKNELNKLIATRAKYESWDFKIVHFLIWLSIFASFSSSIMVAANVNIEKALLAIIAGIPGLVVVVEKSFDFARRTAWDTMYKIDMQELKDDVDFEKIGYYEAAKKLRKIIRRNEAAFLKIGFFEQDRENQTGNIVENNEDHEDEVTREPPG